MSAPMKLNKIYKIYPKFSHEAKNSEVPVPRSGHRIIVTDSCLYSIGGYNPDFWSVENVDEDTNYPLFRELWKFTFATGKWSKLDALDGMPDTLASHAAIRYGNNLIMFGGTSVPFGETSSNIVSICNLSTLKWQHMDTDGDLPIPSYGGGLCVLDKQLYTCGGTTGWEYNIDVRRLDLTSCEWQLLPPEQSEKPPYFIPHERYRHEIATDGEKIYVFGGGRAMFVYTLEQIPAFDLGKRIWENLSTRPDPSHGYPAPRRCHGCAQLQNDVYICGGYNGQEIYGDLWHINLQDLRWRKYDTAMPEPAYFHSTAITQQGRLYIFGGVIKLDVKRTSEVYAVQLRMPSLRESCWHVITNCARDLEHVPQETLVQMGIPRDLIARVH